MTKLIVRDVMNRDPVTVTARTPFKELAALLAGKELAAVPVLDRAGKVTGMVTEADLLRKQVSQPVPGAPRTVPRTYRARWARAAGDCAGEVMDTRPVTIGPEATVAEAARLMGQHHCACLAVADPSGTLSGTVTALDLLRVFLRPDGEITADIGQEILAGGYVAAPGDVTTEVTDGVVTVSGHVRSKSMLPAVLAAIRGIDGVVDVEGRLTYSFDDTRIPVGAVRSRAAAGDRSRTGTIAPG